jgi:potassium-transporting ATPase KdpC subunit
MRRQILPAILMVIVMTVLLGGVYPLVVTGVSQVAFNGKANGSMVSVNGTEVGSSLIGQSFTGDTYFWPRPSAAGDGYDAMASAASNLGPNDETLLSDIDGRVKAYREANGLAADATVPVDAVTASASGLDPQISVANADLQAPRVAKARGLTLEQVQSLVTKSTESPSLGILGEKAVNVLHLNLLLDQATAG